MSFVERHLVRELLRRLTASGFTSDVDDIITHIQDTEEEFFTFNDGAYWMRLIVGNEVDILSDYGVSTNEDWNAVLDGFDADSFLVSS